MRMIFETQKKPLGRNSWLALGLALLALVEAGQAAEGVGAKEQEFGDSIFPRQLGLENRWETFRSRSNAPNARTLESLLEESAVGSGLVPGRGSLYTAIWTELNRYLLALPANEQAILRQAQDRKAIELGLNARELEGRELLETFRRLPWAACLHPAMLEMGQKALVEGNSGLALRTFQDVLARASTADLRAKAQVGVWLALANESDEPAVLEAAFEGVAPEAEFPWLGMRKPAAFIKRQLLAGLKPRAVPTQPAASLDQLAWRLLRTPPYSPWTYRGYLRHREEVLHLLPPACGELRWCDNLLLLGGPNLLVCYRDDAEKPLWARTPLDMQRDRKQEHWEPPALPVPGLFRPAVGQRAVIARWGFDRSQQYLTGLAAFDRETGEMLWSTGNDPDWRDLWPASDPVLAEGAVYVLALREGAGVMSPLWLLCLSPETGKLLWKRMLGSGEVGLPRGRGAPPLPRSQIDLAHYGNAVTVKRGAIFCVTQLGFVARCDPRDGLVDWVYLYPRVQLGTNLYEVMQRQGAAPAVCGNAVVFMPRDAAALFALEAETGRLLWENSEVRARALVGVHDGLALVRNERQIIALKVLTGEVAWEKSADAPILGEPQLVGGSLFVGTRRSLARLDAASGKVLEERKWESAEPVRQFVVGSSNIFLLRDDSAGLARESAPTQTAGRPGPLALPLAPVWGLPGNHPVLWTPPPEAALTNTIFCHAEGVLHCLRIGATVETIWQRHLRNGFGKPAWGEGLLVLADRASVVAVNATTGWALWEKPLPFDAADIQVCGAYLLVADLRRGVAAGMRMADGEMAWERALPVAGAEQRKDRARLAWDGQRLHVFGPAPRAGSELRDFVLDVKTGAVVETRPLFKIGQMRGLRSAFGQRLAFFWTSRGEAFEYSMADGKLTAHTNLPSFDEGEWPGELQMAEPWVLVRTRSRRGRENERELHVRKLGDPSFVLQLTTTGRGEISGNNLLVISGTEALVRSVDLLTKKETMFQGPPQPQGGPRALVLNCRLETDRFWMLTGDGRADERLQSLSRVEVFDRASGTKLGSQRLSGLDTWRAAGEDDDEEWWGRPQPVAWTDGALVCADRRGVHVFMSVLPGQSTGRVLRGAHRVADPIIVDGKLDDWAGHSGAKLHGAEGSTGRIYLAHDESRLFLAVCYADAFVVPSPGDASAGDRLEVGVTGAENRFRAVISADARKGVVWEVLSGTLPRGSKAAMRHDPVRRQLCYEAAIPLRGLVGDGEKARRLELGVVVWDDGPGNLGSVRRLSWSGRTGNELGRADYEPVYLDPFTPGGAHAAQAIVKALPDLPESADLLAAWWAPQGELRESLLPFTRDLLKKHPTSLAAERLLFLMDTALRSSLQDDPSPHVLALAEEAGVPAAVRERYRRQLQTYPSQRVSSQNRHLPHSVADCAQPSTAQLVFAEDRPYLSQWLWIDPEAPPKSIVISLHHDSGRHCHAYWGAPVGRGLDMGPLPAAGQWSQLRLPLHWAGFETLPIQTLAFSQAGGKAVWDRTSLVLPGGEQMVIDGNTPSLRLNRRRREWHPWVTNRVGNTFAVPGRIGDALYCDGRTGYMEAPHCGALDPPNLTVEAWVWLETYPLGGENRRWVVNKNWHESTEGHYGLILRGTRAGVYLNIGGGDAGRYELWSGERSIQLRQWHHLAFTYDSAILKFYFDGQMVTNLPINKVRVPQNYPLHIGRRQDGYVYSEVATDEVRIYNRALTAEEIRASFQSPGSSGKDAQVAHWGFEGEAAPADPGAAWQWVSEPVKLSKRARLQIAGQGYASHVAPLHEPITAHLPFQPSNAVAVAILKAHIPQLGPTDHAYRFLESLMQLSGLEPTNKIATYKWFVTAMPTHPRAPEALGRLLQEFERAGEPDARRAVDEFLARAKIPARTAYHYNRRYAYPHRPLIRQWQLLGPFPNEEGKGLDTPYAPELEGVQLGKKQTGAFGEIAWQKFESRWDFIDLGSVYGGIEKAVAYAVCWVYSDQDRTAALIAGSDEECKVWINGALVLRAVKTAPGRVSESIVPIQLKSGWNEVLVKLAHTTGEWGFELEITDASLSRAPNTLVASTLPPKP